MPVDEVGPGQDELVAVVAVHVPGAGVAVDDRLEGAEAAFGRGGFAGEVDGEGFGLLPRHGFAAGQEETWLGCSRAGDPDRVQRVVQTGVGAGEV